MLLTKRVQALINILAVHCVIAGGILFTYWLLDGGTLPGDALGVVVSGVVIYGG